MAIVDAIPVYIRSAAAIGFGLIMGFIGLKNMGFVVVDPMAYGKFGVWT